MAQISTSTQLYYMPGGYFAFDRHLSPALSTSSVAWFPRSPRGHARASSTPSRPERVRPRISTDNPQLWQPERLAAEITARFPRSRPARMSGLVLAQSMSWYTFVMLDEDNVADLTDDPSLRRDLLDVSRRMRDLYDTVRTPATPLPEVFTPPFPAVAPSTPPPNDAVPDLQEVEAEDSDSEEEALSEWNYNETEVGEETSVVGEEVDPEALVMNDDNPGEDDDIVSVQESIPEEDVDMDSGGESDDDVNGDPAHATDYIQLDQEDEDSSSDSSVHGEDDEENPYTWPFDDLEVLEALEALAGSIPLVADDFSGNDGPVEETVEDSHSAPDRGFQELMPQDGEASRWRDSAVSPILPHHPLRPAHNRRDVALSPIRTYHALAQTTWRDSAVSPILPEDLSISGQPEHRTGAEYVQTYREVESQSPPDPLSGITLREPLHSTPVTQEVDSVNQNSTDSAPVRYRTVGVQVGGDQQANEIISCADGMAGYLPSANPSRRTHDHSTTAGDVGPDFTRNDGHGVGATEARERRVLSEGSLALHARLFDVLPVESNGGRISVVDNDIQNVRRHDDHISRTTLESDDLSGFSSSWTELSSEIPSFSQVPSLFDESMLSPLTSSTRFHTLEVPGGSPSMGSSPVALLYPSFSAGTHGSRTGMGDGTLFPAQVGYEAGPSLLQPMYIRHRQGSLGTPFTTTHRPAGVANSAPLIHQRGRSRSDATPVDHGVEARMRRRLPEFWRGGQVAENQFYPSPMSLYIHSSSAMPIPLPEDHSTPRDACL